MQRGSAIGACVSAKALNYLQNQRAIYDRAGVGSGPA